MAKLQLQALNVMRLRYLAAQEIIQERSAAIESGKLKGRRLFDYSMQNEGQAAGSIRNVHEWSSMGQGSEVRSLSSFYNSEVEHEEEIESNGSKGIPGCSKSSSSSFSSPRLLGASEDKDEEGKRVEDIVATVAETKVDTDSRTADNIGGRYIVFFSGLVIALLVLAICMSSARRFGGCEMILVPT